jgi:hypothetical protein
VVWPAHVFGTNQLHHFYQLKSYWLFLGVAFYPQISSAASFSGFYPPFHDYSSRGFIAYLVSFSHFSSRSCLFLWLLQNHFLIDFFSLVAFTLLHP